MNVKDLKEIIKDVPDDATVIIDVFCCDDYYSKRESPDKDSVYYQKKDNELLLDIGT